MLALDLRGAWPGSYVPVRAEAEEAISRCFEVTVDLLSDTSEVDPAGLLAKPAAVALGGPGQARQFVGVVTGLTCLGTLPQDRYWYRLQIEPGLRLFGLTRRSRVFCADRPATVPQVIEQVLASGIGARAPASVRFDLKTTAYPLRDMVVQHDETDLDFLSRLAERSGIFWILDSEEAPSRAAPGRAAGEAAGSETLFFADSNFGLPVLQNAHGGSSLAFRPPAAVADPEPAVRAATLASQLVPRGASLNEWVPSAPGMVLRVESPAVPGGIGEQRSAGEEHYGDVAWGQTLAAICAERDAAERSVLTAESDVAAVAAGSVFALTDHPVAALNQRYLVLSARHHAWQSVAGVEYVLGVERQGSGYGNEFRAIPAATPYRAPRRTPWPRIPGLVRAVIDGAADGRSDVDEDGHYRIVFAFDDVVRPASRSSCRVRLLSPYGGPAEGMHFPLRPGTQVMVAFHNGDPDRPVIVGAVPDTAQKSVVTRANRTKHVIRTAAGITLSFGDGRGRGS